MRLLLAALLLFISASASAAGCTGTGNCYWVGGTGNVNDTTHWATTDGGATTGGLPTSADSCNFTNQSSTANAAYTFTINAATQCLDFVMDGPGGGNKVTWAGSSPLTVLGSMNLSGGTSGITRTHTGGMAFQATTSGKTITTNGVTFTSNFTFQGVGGAWTLQDNLDIASGTISATTGTLDTNGKSVTAGRITHSTTTSFTLTLGASAVTLNDTSCLVWSGTNFTLNAGTSTISCTGAAVSASLSSGDSYTFNNLSITPTGISTLTFSAAQTVGGTLTLTGSSPNTRLAVFSFPTGTSLTITAATVSLTDVDFRDTTGAGAATWTGTRIGDRLGNSGITTDTPVTKFWVGGTGNWSDAANHWATSTGGVAGANNYPLPQDNVTFDTLSNATAYTVTVNQVAFITDLNFSAAPLTSGTITWAGSSAATIYGSLTALTGMTRTFTGAITFAARSSGKTITSHSVAYGGQFSWDGPGGAWTLQDNLNVGSSNTLVQSGTLDTNGKTFTASTIFHTATTSATLTLGASAVNLSGAQCLNWTTTGLTLNGNTSTITCSTAQNPVLTSGDSYTFNNLSMAFASATSLTLNLGASQTVSGTLTLTGASAVTHPLIQASTAGVATPGAGPYTITAATTSLTDVDFTDITGAGAAAWTGTRIGNCKGNSGITFTTGVNKFYVGNTNTWSAANVWATSSGGAGATNNFPLCQDTAKLDAGSFSANGQTLTMSAHRIPGIIAASTDQTYTIAFSAAPSVYGDLTLDANATISGTSNLTMVGRNTQTITSAGKAWTNAVVTINSPGGTVKFGDAFTGSGNSIVHTRGALDLNGQNVTTGDFTSNNSNTRTIKDGSGGGKIITTGSAASVFIASTTTGLTVDRTNSWTIEIGGNTAIARTATFGPTDGSGPSWPTVTFTNTTASGQLNLTGGGTLKSLVVSVPPQTLNFTAGTTHKIENANGFPSGTAGNLVTVKSATAASAFTLNSVSNNQQSSDYLTISDSSATPATTCWFAGTHSTDGGGNTGWTFTAPSGSCGGGGVTYPPGNFLPFLQ